MMKMNDSMWQYSYIFRDRRSAIGQSAVLGATIVGGTIAITAVWIGIYLITGNQLASYLVSLGIGVPVLLYGQLRALRREDRVYRSRQARRDVNYAFENREQLREFLTTMKARNKRVTATKQRQLQTYTDLEKDGQAALRICRQKNMTVRRIVAEFCLRRLTWWIGETHRHLNELRHTQTLLHEWSEAVEQNRDDDAFMEALGDQMARAVARMSHVDESPDPQRIVLHSRHLFDGHA